MSASRPMIVRVVRLCAAIAMFTGAPTPATSQEKGVPKMSINVTSSAFGSDARIPDRFTGDGQDVSPSIAIQDVPAAAKELALICDDPDAPTPQPWVHWVIYKIPPQTRNLPEGIAPVEKPVPPAGVLQGKNSWRGIGYRGPAPPGGGATHHYHFKLYALDEDLGLKPGLDRASLLKAIKGHVLAEGELVGTYSRK
jgi:Raf kinase inhibitor-like YbhB/YbcL family protein